MIDKYKMGLGNNTVYLNGKPCQVLCVAEHFETKDKMAVYQELHGDFACFAKPLDVFEQEVSDSKPADAKEEPCTEEFDADEKANPILLEFLDTDTLDQKYQILKRLGNSITNRLIDDFAVVLDLVIPEGTVDYRYQQLLNSVRTMQQYENTRLFR